VPKAIPSLIDAQAELIRETATVTASAGRKRLTH